VRYGNFVHKGTGAVKLLVNRSKAHISHLVDFPQLFHNQLADAHAGDLTIQGALQSGLDLRNRSLQSLYGHRSLFAGAEHTFQNLVAVKDLTAFVLLHHNNGHILNDLISGKALAALHTLPTTANALILVGRTRVNHFALCITAKWTLHSYPPC
jgi:hypothetical protein